MDDSLLPQFPGNGYITLQDLRIFAQSIEKYGSLEERLGNDHTLYQDLVLYIKKIRDAHLGLAMKFIGKENLTGSGTGGAQNAGDFLRAHIAGTVSKIIF